MAKWTEQELTCPECAAEGVRWIAKNPNGLRGHRQFKHNVLPSSTGQLPLEQQDLLVTDGKLAQLLDERFAVVSEQLDGLSGSVDALNEQLGQEHQDRLDNVAVLDERVKAAEARTIGDFPSEERARYFIQFIAGLSDEDKALLAEKVDWKVRDATPEEVAEAEAEEKAEFDEKPLLVQGKTDDQDYEYSEKLDLSIKKDRDPKPEKELLIQGKTEDPAYEYAENIDLSILKDKEG